MALISSNEKPDALNDNAIDIQETLGSDATNELLSFLQIIEPGIFLNHLANFTRL